MIRRFATAAEFRMAVGPFLGAREAEHNLMFGISSNLIADEARGVEHHPAPYLAVAEQHGRIVVAALMTPPFNLVLSCVAPGSDVDTGAAIDAFVADLAAFDTLPMGVTGPEATARPFAAAWCEPRGLTIRRVFAERIYQVERVKAPDGVPGKVRVATAADRGILVEFVKEFLVEALDQDDDAHAQSLVDRGLEQGQRTFYVWEDRGRIVSMAASGGPTPNGIRNGLSIPRAANADVAMGAP